MQCIVWPTQYTQPTLRSQNTIIAASDIYLHILQFPSLALHLQTCGVRDAVRGARGKQTQQPVATEIVGISWD